MAGLSRIAVDFSVDTGSLDRGMRKATVSLDKFAAAFTKKFIGTAGLLTLVDRLGNAAADVFARMNQQIASGQALSWIDALTESYIKFAESLPIVGGAFRALNEVIVGSVTAETAALERQNDIMQKRIDVNRKAADAAEKAARRAAQAAEEAARREQQALDDAQLSIIVGLRKEILEFGMSEEAIQLRNAALAGASEYTLRFIEDLQKELRALRQVKEETEKADEALEEFYRKGQERARRDEEEAQRIRESLKTPMDRYNDRINELSRLLLDNRITEKEFDAERDKAIKQRDEELRRNAGTIHAFDSIQALNQLFTGKLGIGSFSTAKDPAEKTADNTEAVKDNTDETNELLRRLITTVQGSNSEGIGF